MRTRPPLQRSAAVESFAAQGAMNDTLNKSAHQHFLQNPGAMGAENEWLRQPMIGGTIQSTMAQAIALFYGEGPGGGHYENVIGPYTESGCGVYVSGNGSDGITIVQDFR